MSIRPRKKSMFDRLTTVDEAQAIMPLVPSLFILLGFGYMLLWTAIGSRIKDLLVDYGPSFFTEINVIFYIMGLPISLIQKRYDHILDLRYRSKITFRFRVYLGMVFLMIICLILPIADYICFLILSFFMSIFTWTIHNTVCKLANVVGYRTAAFQQIGFVLPGVICLLLTYLLPTISDSDNANGGKRKMDGSPDYTNKNKWKFYGIIAGMILLSLFGSIFLLKMRIIKSKLGTRDKKLDSFDDIPKRTSTHMTTNPIMEKDIENNNNNREDNKDSSGTKDRESNQSAESEGDDDIGSILETAYTDALERETTFQGLASESQDSQDRKNDLLSNSMVTDSPKGEDGSCTTSASFDENYYNTTQFYLMSLFIALYCSILEASFISFVHSASGEGNGIVTVLYFVRIFSDLLGRPLTFIASYLYLDRIENIFYLALFRILLLVMFFLYVFAPLHWNMKNDAFIIILQGCISLSSGFIVVSVYDLASNLFKTEALRNKCVDDLNIAFQAASACAALTGLIILASIGVF